VAVGLSQRRRIEEDDVEFEFFRASERMEIAVHDWAGPCRLLADGTDERFIFAICAITGAHAFCAPSELLLQALRGRLNIKYNACGKAFL